MDRARHDSAFSCTVTAMTALGPGTDYIDLDFRGRQRAIAAVVLHGAGGVALVDPGPTSTLPVLRRALDAAGMTLADITTILLTHIHLDHAGCVGTLLHERPHLRVLVHEVGAPHLVDPAKLLSSASRLYGDAMETLWGEVRPVPEGAIESLQGGEQLQIAGQRLDVVYTPGHASHHVSYFAPDSGIAFVGDTGGVRVVEGGFVLPPTPPPDIDLERWEESLQAIERWRPGTLFLTHFGAVNTPAPHLAELRQHIEVVARLAKASLEQEGDDSAKESWFVQELRRELRRRLPEAEASRYELSARFDLNWRGLARYWRKRAA